MGRNNKSSSTPVATAAVPETAVSDCPMMNLVLWTDVQKSGMIFGGVFCLLTALYSWTVLGLASYVLFWATCLSSGFVFGKSILAAFQGQNSGGVSSTHPFQELLTSIPPKVELSNECVEKIVSQVVPKINQVTTALVRLVLVDKFLHSAVFVGALYVLNPILNQFTVLCLMSMTWIGIFTVPKVYTMYKAQIDDAALKVWTPVQPHLEKLSAMVKKFQPSLNKEKATEEVPAGKSD